MWESLLELTLGNPIVRSLGISVLRAAFGYVENCIKEKQGFSLQKFGQTVFRVIPQALGWTAAGIPPEVAFLSDWVVTKAASKNK